MINMNQGVVFNTNPLYYIVFTEKYQNKAFQ